jgi:hypothetical protein
MIWTVFLGVVVGVVVYVFVIFYLTRLFIPHMGFVREPLPERIPKSMMSEIKLLKKKVNADKLRGDGAVKARKKYLRLVYDRLSGQYHGGHLATITKLERCFYDIEKIWAARGFMPCNVHNYLLRIFLIKSKLFREDEIRIRYTTIWFNIHQYSKVRIGKEWIDVDVWGKKFGVLFGEHAFLFQ